MKLHVKKGDTVMVIAGSDKGKSGKVLKVYPEKNRAIVEGRNLVKKHTKPNAKNTQGGIVEQEAPIHLSNLMVIDADGNPTRIGRRIDEKTGKLVRYSKKSADKKEIK
ncbi:MAG: 50S ribosomal protein L24 [Bacteroidales bacterium]|nr:50S ribosomal protein L24 [Bacteroidales bacterium]